MDRPARFRRFATSSLGALALAVLATPAPAGIPDPPKPPTDSAAVVVSNYTNLTPTLTVPIMVTRDAVGRPVLSLPPRTSLKVEVGFNAGGGINATLKARLQADFAFRKVPGTLTAAAVDPSGNKYTFDVAPLAANLLAGITPYLTDANFDPAALKLDGDVTLSLNEVLTPNELKVLKSAALKLTLQPRIADPPAAAPQRAPVPSTQLTPAASGQSGTAPTTPAAPGGRPKPEDDTVPPAELPADPTARPEAVREPADVPPPAPEPNPAAVPPRF